MRPIKNSSRRRERDISLPRPRTTRIGSVRIIAGMWRKTPLVVAESDGLRPTGDRVRETLFNWLTHFKGDFSNLTGLDVFAGSGALGFEFASRGALHVTFIEKSREAANAIRATKDKLKAEQIKVIQGDALLRLDTMTETFDVIFIDPPFAKDLHTSALQKAVSRLAPEGLIYVEAPNEVNLCETFKALGLCILRESKAGAVTFRLLEKSGVKP